MHFPVLYRFEHAKSRVESEAVIKAPLIGVENMLIEIIFRE